MNVKACQPAAIVARTPASTPLLCAEGDSELWAYQYALDQFAAIALTDLTGHILDVNDRFCQLLQYRREELIGQNYSRFQSRMQSEAAAQSLWQAIAAGQPWQGEILNSAQDGSRCWVKTSLLPLRDASGKIHRYLFTSQDVTEQKRWVEQQQQQRQALIQQRALNQSLKVRLDGSNHILHLIANGVPLEESLTAIAELTETLASELHCAIMVVDPKRGELCHRAAPSLPRSFVEMMDELPITPQGGAFAAAAHGKRTVTVADITADTQAHYVNDLALAHGLRACWASPILVRGKVAAVLGMYYSQPQYPSETDQRLIARAMELTQVAMERHRSEAALRSKLEETLLLREITQKIRQSLDNQEIFHTTVTQVRSLLQADRVAIAHLAPVQPSSQPPNQRPGEIADTIEDNEPDEIVAAALALAAAKPVPRFIAEDVQAPFHSILDLEDWACELWLSQPDHQPKQKTTVNASNSQRPRPMGYRAR